MSDTRGRILAVAASLALIASGLVWFSSAALAATEEDVTRDHDADWHQAGTDCGLTGTGSQGFEPGPVGVPTGEPNESAEPPVGTGSLRMALGPNGDSLEENRNTRYAGKLLADLITLDYWTYVATAPPSFPGDHTPAIYLGLDLDLTGDNRVDDTLVFEPGFQSSGQGDVTPGRWQHWFATGPGSDWYLESAQSEHQSLDQWAIQLTGARITNVDEDHGGLFVAAGCTDTNWVGFTGHVDGVAVTFRDEGDGLLYDMDPPSVNEPRRLDCEPETDSNPTGSSHTITCTVENDQGLPVEDVHVDAEATGANDPETPSAYTPRQPDFDSATHCTTDEDGECDIIHGGTTSPTSEAGQTTYRIWIDVDENNNTTEADPTEGRNEESEEGSRPDPENAPDDTDVVQKTWLAVPQLQCDPEVAGPRTGSAHTVTCNARDASGAPVTGTPIDMEATGVNNPDGNATLTSPDFSCTTSTNGSCSMIHGPAPGGRGTTTTAGTTTYRAWVDTSNSNTVAEADTGEGRDEGATPGSRTEPDNTDVMEAIWSATGSTPTPSASGTPGPTLSPCPTGSPTPSQSPSPSPSPSTSPSGSPSPTPSPSPCATPQPTPTPTPTPRPTPSTSPTDSPRFCRGEGDNMMLGTPGDDVLVGTSADDVICGFSGNDVISGRGGDDTLRGGKGADTIRGNRGNDKLRGGKGRDSFRGGSGRDVLHGGPDADNLRGGKGRDRLFGGRGNDRCVGGPGRDRRRSC